MTYARTTYLACSLMAAAALTACGGGGEKGPAWAVTAKNELAAPAITTPVDPAPADITPPSSGEYLSDCFSASTPGKSIQYSLLPTQTGSIVKMGVKLYYFNNEDCALAGRAFVAYYPDATLNIDSTTPGVKDGTVINQVSSSYPEGKVRIAPEGSAATVARTLESDGSINNLITLKDGNTIGIPDQTALEEKDLLYFEDGFLYRGDLNTIDEAVSPYPANLDLTNVFTLVP